MTSSAASLATCTLNTGLQPEKGCDVTVLEAVYHVIEHFSMHTGQIILLTKMWKGDLGFYEVSAGTARERWHE